VQEGDPLPFGAHPWTLVDEADPRGPAAFEGTLEVVDREAEVVDAGPRLSMNFPIGESATFGSSSSTSASPACSPAMRAPSASSSGTSGIPRTSR
jgi:hypothetical protein